MSTFYQMCFTFDLCVCLCVCMYVHTSAGGCGGQQGVLNLLELELQVVVNGLACAVGTELGSGTRAVYALNHWLISLAP